MPALVWNNSNYFRDIVFVPSEGTSKADDIKLAISGEFHGVDGIPQEFNTNFKDHIGIVVVNGELLADVGLISNEFMNAFGYGWSSSDDSIYYSNYFNSENNRVSLAFDTTHNTVFSSGTPVSGIDFQTYTDSDGSKRVRADVLAIAKYLGYGDKIAHCINEDGSEEYYIDASRILPYIGFDTIASITIDFVPLIGNIKMSIEAYKGYDIITGQPFSNTDRIIVGICMLVPVAGKSIKIVKEGFMKISTAIEISEKLKDVEKLEKLEAIKLAADALSELAEFVATNGIKVSADMLPKVLNDLCKGNIDFAKRILLSTKQVVSGKTVIELVDILNLVEKPALSSLTNYEARIWYSWQKSLIKSKMDFSKPLEQVAIDACEMRNSIRRTARDIMKDQELAQFLDVQESMKTFAELITYYSSKGFSEDALWNEIIDASMRGRGGVDILFEIAY